MTALFHFVAYNMCCRTDSDKLCTGIFTKVKQKSSVVPSQESWCCLAKNY